LIELELVLCADFLNCIATHIVIDRLEENQHRDLLVGDNELSNLPLGVRIINTRIIDDIRLSISKSNERRGWIKHHPIVFVNLKSLLDNLFFEKREGCAAHKEFFITQLV
jgi:hypothetical protein